MPATIGVVASARVASRATIGPAASRARAASDARAGAADAVVTVTCSAADRALSSTPPSSTNDASCSACAPGVSGGSRDVHAKPAAVADAAHVTPAASVRVPST